MCNLDNICLYDFNFILPLRITNPDLSLFVFAVMETVELMNRFLTGTNLEEVVDAYLHALTSRRPLSRYVVGWNGNIVFRTLWMMPSWVTDLLVRAVFPAPSGR